MLFLPLNLFAWRFFKALVNAFVGSFVDYLPVLDFLVFLFMIFLLRLLFTRHHFETQAKIEVSIIRIWMDLIFIQHHKYYF